MMMMMRLEFAGRSSSDVLWAGDAKERTRFGHEAGGKMPPQGG